MLGRVMAKPTRMAWNEALGMMQYMYQNRLRGIKFRSDGNHTPVAFVDASNKPDPTDGKCQYGYVHMFMGGPIMMSSKKLAHVGLSASHNEYMAMHWCHRHTTWLRDLLLELGLGDVVQEPTLTYGDNTTAIQLCEEEIISSGNQYIYTPYHYNKEVERKGIAKAKWVPTKENLADVMTKCVDAMTHKALVPDLTGNGAMAWIQTQKTWKQPRLG